MAFSKAHRVKRVGRKDTALSWRGRLRLVNALAAVAPVALAAVCGGVAKADTTGGYGLNGNGVLSLLGFDAPIEQPSSFDDFANFTAVDLTNVTFALIRNEYMAVVLGAGGTYGVPYDAGQSAYLIGFANATTLTHNVAGMLTFGNIGGNLRGNADNFQALNGFSAGEFFQTSGKPAGYGVWPLP
ncbi:MAG TPA: hypothetical protein VM490_18045, partial [Armatimonadaceae bacterium]|nr:hypothetical protein [Armatimonadaceae bacterium]